MDLVAYGFVCWLILYSYRIRADHWKSGFYHLALATGVPVGLAYIDYPSRRVGLDTFLDLSGDEARDMARIRAYYADKRGRNPAQQSDIRFLRSGARAGNGT